MFIWLPVSLSVILSRCHVCCAKCMPVLHATVGVFTDDICLQKGDIRDCIAAKFLRPCTLILLLKSGPGR